MNNEAVSPVVGVMLMLVVTIIIAAVVSAFAGGLAENQEKAPQASLECSISEGGMSGHVFTMKHLSGEPINTRNVKLVTSWVDTAGEFHVQNTVAPTWVETEEVYYCDGVTTSHYNVSSLNTESYGSYYHAPYKIAPGDMPADGSNEEETLWFGNYIMRAGDVTKADMNLDSTNPETTPLIADFGDLTANDVVTVKLIDLKSGSTIYDKDIVMEA